MSGLMAITGPADGPPCKVGVALADILTGLYAATAILAGLLTIPIVLMARLLSVWITVAALNVRGQFGRGFVPVLTWSGLRGGLSVAMVLSLPPFAGRDLLLACTYAVVVFSILVQGLTVRRVLVYYGVGDTRSRA